MDTFQRSALSLMGVLAVLTFFAANLQALLWQSSDWLVSTVLPSVVIELTNEERLENDTQPLVRNPVLDEAARMKAEHMAANEYFSHYSPDGVSPWYWFDEAGYVYAHAGENLAIHFTDSSEVVDAWMDSPTHRENIVNRQYTEIGVGTAKGTFEGYDTVYVVQLFGTPGVSAPVADPAPPAPQPVAAPVEPEVVTNVVPEPILLADTPTAPPAPVEETEPVVITETIPVPVPVAAPTPDPVLTQPVTAATPEPAPTQPVAAVVQEVAAEEVHTQSVQDAVPTQDVIVPAASIPVERPEIVVVQSPLIATSSGLAVAEFTQATEQHAGVTRASLATQPSTFLQVVYLVLGMLILFLLTTSIVLEARQLHYIQVGYSFMLLIGMGGLWFVHVLLTEGAVIV
jgi:uncharacterized protein YkwD